MLQWFAIVTEVIRMKEMFQIASAGIISSCCSWICSLFQCMQLDITLQSHSDDERSFTF